MLPLHDVRVLEVGGQGVWLAGRLLADLGAHVTLLEPPEGGVLRQTGPFAGGGGDGESWQHLYFNVNKRSVALDWRKEDGRARLLELAAAADVLLEGHQPGEFPVEAVRAVNPQLLVISVSPYGQRGERAAWRATDLTATAAGGLLAVSGERSDPPTHGPAYPGFTMSGLTAFSAALTALHGRDRTAGRPGVQIEVSMQRAVSFAVIQTSNPNTWRWRGEAPRRPALSQAIECADGKWMACNVGANKLPQFLAMLEEAGVPHGLDLAAWEADWQREFGADRGAWQYLENPLQQLAIKLAAVWPRDQLLERLWAAQMPAMPTLRFSEFAETDHYPNSDQFQEIPTPSVGRALSYSRSPLEPLRQGEPLRPAPALGADSGAPPPLLARDEGAAAAFPSNPLAGIRVLDLTWVAAGPLTTRLLANFGADVIKVESSGARIDPVRAQLVQGEAAPDLADLFNDVNTGKRSVTLNLADERGKDLLRRLAAHADVLVNNFSAGSLARMGFPYDQLQKINPRLIVLHLPGIGGRSPWRPLRSLGNLLQAVSGMNFLMGWPGRPPRGMGVAYPDFTSPHLGAAAVLAALRQREVTGQGQEIELSQLSATVSLLGAQWLQFEAEGSQDLPQPGNTDPNCSPHGVFPCDGEDQWVALALEEDAQWAAFAEVIGRAEWAADESCQTVGGRRKREEAIAAAIGAWTARRSKWEAAAALQAAGIAANAVEDLRDMMDVDEPFRAHYQRIEQPSRPGFGVWIDGAPWEFAHLEPRRLARAPMLGEHTQAVLRELADVDDAEFAALAADGVLS